MIKVATYFRYGLDLLAHRSFESTIIQELTEVLNHQHGILYKIFFDLEASRAIPWPCDPLVLPILCYPEGGSLMVWPFKLEHQENRSWFFNTLFHLNPSGLNGEKADSQAANRKVQDDPETTFAIKENQCTKHNECTSKNSRAILGEAKLVQLEQFKYQNE